MKKNDLVEKFVQSEKLKAEIKKEREEEKARLENANTQLESLADQSQQLEEQIQELKDAGATEDEISKIEQKQQELEDQIKSVEQEKAYLETVDGVIESTNENLDFSICNPGLSIKSVYGIYEWGSRVYFQAELVQTETIAGVEFSSVVNGLCNADTFLDGDESYEEVLDRLSRADIVRLSKIYTNRNAESHKEFFEQNKYSMHQSFQKLESLGASFEIVDSWEKEGDSEHPEYIVKCQQEGYEDLLFIISYLNFGYASQSIKKICPEFWAQLEVEQGKDAQSQSDSQAA